MLKLIGIRLQIRKLQLYVSSTSFILPLVEILLQPPKIPIYPMVCKDLTFIDLGNDTKIENLINFEKLRMLAKEVYNIKHKVLNFRRKYTYIRILFK